MNFRKRGEKVIDTISDKTKELKVMKSNNDVVFTEKKR